MLFWIYVILALVICFKTNYNGYSVDWGGLILCLVVGIVCLIIASGVTALLLDFFFVKDYLKEHARIPIVTLKTQQEVHGSFVLGSGGFGSDEQYYFMVDCGNNSYTRMSVPTKDTLITESKESPRFDCDIRAREAQPGIWWPSRFIFRSTYTNQRVLTVPPGTIIQKFEVQ